MRCVYRLEFEARDRLIARLETAFKSRSDVLFALVFGSFLDRDDFRDIDVGIWTTASAGPRVDVELAAVLSEAVGLPVDVWCLNDAPVSFLFHALRGRPVAVQDKRRLADLMERTTHDYHDRTQLLQRATKKAFAK